MWGVAFTKLRKLLDAKLFGALSSENRQCCPPISTVCLAFVLALPILTALK